MKYLIAMVVFGFGSPALADSRVIATCIGGASLAITLEDDVMVARIGTRRIVLRTETCPGEEVHFNGENFHVEIITNLDSWEVGILPGTDASDPHAAFGHLWPQGQYPSGEALTLNCRFE